MGPTSTTTHTIYVPWLLPAARPAPQRDGADGPAQSNADHTLGDRYASFSGLSVIS